jgi:hypothetical protein
LDSPGALTDTYFSGNQSCKGNDMDIDERIQKLTERHEAFSQSVEILTSDVRSMQESMRSMQGFITDIAESTARLLHIAQIHEHRITRLEGGAD